jgi:hypothetical protein
MKWLKIVLYVLLAGFVLIQFFRPERNSSSGPGGNEITRQYAVPAEIHTILKKSCYNCHSNNTDYPWYAEIMPAGWLLSGHIRDAKRVLNFDEFASYKPDRQLLKLEGIVHEVETGEMPLPSYTLLHRDAILSDGQKTLLVGWAESMQNLIRAGHPHGGEE